MSRIDFDFDERLAQITSLGDPVRRTLYRFVVSRGSPVGRDEAAAAVGIGRPLAAYHLDRLVAEGLLTARFERRSGRRGPGAGRPSKLYFRSAREVEVSLPPRDYELAARILAQAVDSDPSATALERVEDAARTTGADLADERLAAAQRTGEDRPSLVETLRQHGYEPYLEGGERQRQSGTIRLRNCPFHKLAAEYRELVCRANLALLQGVVERLGSGDLEPVLAPRPGECCVAFRRARS